VAGKMRFVLIMVSVALLIGALDAAGASVTPPPCFDERGSYRDR